MSWLAIYLLGVVIAGVVLWLSCHTDGIDVEGHLLVLGTCVLFGALWPIAVPVVVVRIVWMRWQDRKS